MSEPNPTDQTIATLKAALTARAEHLLSIQTGSQASTGAGDGKESGSNLVRIEKASSKLSTWLQGFLKKNRKIPRRWFTRVHDHSGLYEQLLSYGNEMRKAGSELKSAHAALAKRVHVLEKKVDAMAVASDTRSGDHATLIAVLNKEMRDLRQQVQKTENR